MSWIKIVGKDIWHVAEFAAGIDANPAVSGMVGAIPVAGPIINTIFDAIRQVEGMLPSGNGALKKSVVTASIKTANPAIDEARLSNTIDSVVAALNALEAAFKTMQ